MTVIGPQLLARLLDEHGRALELLAAQHCRAAADVVQEAFIELAAQAAVPDRPVAWLYRVVRNRAISAARSERRRWRHESSAADRRAWFAPRCVTRDHTAIEPEAVAAALAELGVDQREVVVAYLWGGQTFEEISQWTGTSAATAYRRYHAGLSLLRTKLGVPCPLENSGRTLS